jgi:hypothetical protein
MNKEYTAGFQQMREIYINSVAPNDVKQRILDEQMEQIQEYKKSKLDPVGEEDEDVDNDGKKNTKSDKYLFNRRKVRSQEVEDQEDEDEYDDDKEEDKSSKKKRRKMHEQVDFVAELDGYYNWRATVSEDIQAAIDDLNADQITEKPVNNYKKGVKGKPIIQINPSINIGEAVDQLGGEVVFVQEDLEYLENAIELATDYFYEEGLTAEGVNIILEKLGEEEFCNFVFDIADERLIIEERAAKRRKPGGKTVKQIKDEIEERGARKKPKTTVARKIAVSTAKETQPKIQTTKPTGGLTSQKQVSVKSSTSRPPNKEDLKQVTRGAFSAVSQAAREGIERDQRAREALKKARESGKGFGGQIGSALKAAFFKPEFREWVEYILDEGYDISDWTIDELYEEFEYLEEKAVSEQQQKLFGLALSVKRGDTSRNDASKQVLEIVDSMSETEIRKYAKTSHEGIPKKVDESLSYDDLINFMNK